MIGVNEYLLIMFLISVAAGFIGALVGVGGGILVVPALTLIFQVPIQYAIGASIVSVIATSSGSASAYVRDRITNLRVGMFLEVGTTVGAVTGALTAIYLVTSQLQWVVFTAFGLLMFFTAYNMRTGMNAEKARQRAIQAGQTVYPGVDPDSGATRLRLNGSYYDAAMKRNIDYNATRIPAGFSVMFFAGVVSALLGVGGGILKVVGMDSIMRLPFKVSTTTSNFMIGVTAAASAGIYYVGGYVNPVIAAPVALGVVVGAYLGAKLLVKSMPSLLRFVFLVVLLVVGAEMILQGVSPGL